MDQAGKLRLRWILSRYKDHLINEALPPSATMDQGIFHILQSSQMLLEGRIAALRPGPHIFAAKAEVTSIDLEPLAFLLDGFVDEDKQAPRVRLQLVERSAEHFFNKAVRYFDIVERGFDVGDALDAIRRRLHGPLILAEQSNGTDQNQVLHVIAA